MTEEERRAIAARGGGYQEGKGEITDKGAKDFKEGMGAIATTSKLGGFALLADMFTKITDLGNNPILNTLLNFFQLFGTFLNAAGAEQAQILAEALFKEENVQIMQDLAEATQEATLSVEDLTDSMTAWKTVFDTIAPGYKALEEGLRTWRQEIEWIQDNMPDMTLSVSAFNGELGTFQKLINNFRFPSLGGGGGGDDGDDDDPWWDPYGIFS